MCVGRIRRCRPITCSRRNRRQDRSSAGNARFVSDLGAPVLELLAPKPGERILDLGCGDGVLTKRLVDDGCEVVAVDSSAAQVEAAKTLGLDAYVMAGEDLTFDAEFDAVFSNAVLHWIRRADPMIAAVYRALKPGGRTKWLLAAAAAAGAVIGGVAARSGGGATAAAGTSSPAVQIGPPTITIGKP